MKTFNLEGRLADYQQQQRYRYRHKKPTTATHDFSSNDYLGLSNHPKVITAFQQAAQDYGVGSRASQLVSGHSDWHHRCESAFAEFLQRDRALLFGNGYMANLGVIDAITQTGDRIFQDRHNHASLLDAGRLSNARSQRFDHKNTADLSQRLAATPAEKKLIVSDGVFSMYGDIAPLETLVSLAKTHQSPLMIDDAHGIGVLGDDGRGSLSRYQLTQQDVPILVCPLGKAFGVYGAIVAGSETLIESLIQFSRSYIYTTAIPPALAAAATTSLALMQQETWRRDKLLGLIRYFKEKVKQYDFHCYPSDTAIQSIQIGDATVALEKSEQLKKQGYWVHAMRPPTVPEQHSILRITLTAAHETDQIDQLLERLQ
jgi:8-amino-7-oxononanoate synthase